MNEASLHPDTQTTVCGRPWQKAPRLARPPPPRSIQNEAYAGIHHAASRRIALLSPHSRLDQDLYRLRRAMSNSAVQDNPSARCTGQASESAFLQLSPGGDDEPAGLISIIWPCSGTTVYDGRRHDSNFLKQAGKQAGRASKAPKHLLSRHLGPHFNSRPTGPRYHDLGKWMPRWRNSPMKGETAANVAQTSATVAPSESADILSPSCHHGHQANNAECGRRAIYFIFPRVFEKTWSTISRRMLSRQSASTFAAACLPSRGPVSFETDRPLFATSRNSPFLDGMEGKRRRITHERRRGERGGNTTHFSLFPFETGVSLERPR